MASFDTGGCIAVTVLFDVQWILWTWWDFTVACLFLSSSRADDNTTALTQARTSGTSVLDAHMSATARVSSCITSSSIVPVEHHSSVACAPTMWAVATYCISTYVFMEFLFLLRRVLLRYLTKKQGKMELTRLKKSLYYHSVVPFQWHLTQCWILAVWQTYH